MKNVLVISHERSGTHFLMNTISLNFKPYLYGGWIDLPTNVNKKQMSHFLNNIPDFKNHPIYKSHHQSYNFQDVSVLSNKFHVFYIVRDGRDCLVSTYFHFIKNKWILNRTFSNFLKYSPTFSTHKRFKWYDTKRSSNMVNRWVTHIESWLPYSSFVHFIKYEDLFYHFLDTLSKLSKILKIKDYTYIRPTLQHSCVDPRKGIVGDYNTYFTKKDIKYFNNRAFSIMQRLGYY